MDLYKLKTFKAVAAFLNFNQAAQHLNCAQSTVSGQIKSLEDEIGVLLFKRINKRVKLTPAGIKMVDYANRLLAMEEEAIADLSGKSISPGNLTIRAPEAIIDSYFPGLLNHYLQQRPEVSLDISNCLESSIENELQIERIDLAFIFSDYLSSDHLNTEQLFTEKLLVTTHPDHPLRRKKYINPPDLRGENLLFLKTGCGYGLQFRQLLSTHISKPASIIEMTSVAAIKTCIKQEMGIAVLPESTVAKELDNQELITLNWHESLEATILMAWHKDKRITESLGIFMNLARRLKT